MKKSFIVGIVLAISSINSVFSMDSASVQLSAKDMRWYAEDAKADIRADLRLNGFVTPTTQRKAEITVKLCNTAGYPNLGVEVSKALGSANKSTQYRMDLKNKPKPSVQRKINFEVDSSEGE